MHHIENTRAGCESTRRLHGRDGAPKTFGGDAPISAPPHMRLREQPETNTIAPRTDPGLLLGFTGGGEEGETERQKRGNGEKEGTARKGENGKDEKEEKK